MFEQGNVAKSSATHIRTLFCRYFSLLAYRSRLRMHSRNMLSVSLGFLNKTIDFENRRVMVIKNRIWQLLDLLYCSYSDKGSFTITYTKTETGPKRRREGWILSWPNHKLNLYRGGGGRGLGDHSLHMARVAL